MDKKKEKLYFTCRACLVLSDSMYSIFEEIPQSNINIANMLKNCSIEVGEDDNFPKTFCFSCFAELQAVHSFIQTFKTSQKLLLQQYLKEYNRNIIVNEGRISNISNYVEKDFLEINKITMLNSEFVEDVTNIIDNEDAVENFVIKCETDKNGSNGQDFLNNSSVKVTHELNRKNYIKCKLQNNMATQSCQYEKNKNNCSKNQQNCVDNNSLKVEPSNQVIITCPLCPKTFKRFTLFSIHVTQHNKNITCNLCSMEFDDVEVFLKHYQIKHRYQCKICLKSFPRGDTYNRHMQVHNNTLPKFVCPVENCSKSFSVKQSLRNHYKTIHCDKHNFLCNLCGASFKNYDNLRYHMKKHKGPSYLCTYCGRAFMQAVHLTYHMWRHTGVKPYKCTDCEKSFVSKKILLTHVKKNCESLKKS